MLVVYSALGVEIGIVETASIKPQRSADVTRGFHPFPIPLTLQSMVPHNMKILLITRIDAGPQRPLYCHVIRF